MDKLQKHNLYEKALVKEYWIVDPQNEPIEVYHLKQDLHEKPHFFQQKIRRNPSTLKD